ncbi:EF-hand domain-containing protein D2-like isoform X1 [Lineus longissimus]|uniref:EF-hand domain-containing protein D2-like isoform X1 n=1 Tax=Lineus longissimus TaxID=88925 RepID=UPI002B4CE50F
MSETEELASKLARRNQINEGETPPPADCAKKPFNPYVEFPNFSRKEIKRIEKLFKSVFERKRMEARSDPDVDDAEFDDDRNNFLDMLELKRLMEKLGSPQTHLGLKAMIKEVDEDEDGMISFREFCLVYKKAQDGELECEGLKELCAKTEVDVDEVGVGGAKDFFEAKIKQQTIGNKFEEEIKQEQEERKQEAEEAKIRKQAFKEKAALFN